MEAYIKYIEYYLPAQTLDNDALALVDSSWDVEKIAKKVGIKSRHIAALQETATDMAIEAARALFSKYPLEQAKVDYVLFCTQSSDYKLPTSACIIQNALGLSSSCGALDFNLGCSGYIYGLSLAKGLVSTGIARNVLVLTSETYSKYLRHSDIGNRIIFGDGASATIVSTTGFGKIGDFVFGTDGSGYDKLIVKHGGARQPYVVPNSDDMDDYLVMDGGGIFDFSSDVIPELVEELLKKNQLIDKDISLYLFHQANRYMLNYIRKLIDVDSERFYINLETTGNTVSSSIPIALVQASESDQLHGQVVLAGFGVGLSWGGVIITI